MVRAFDGKRQATFHNEHSAYNQGVIEIDDLREILMATVASGMAGSGARLHNSSGERATLTGSAFKGTDEAAAPIDNVCR